jgi:hypothetical protein
MGIHRYKQTPIRLNKRDQERLAKIKNWYQCESTTQAIRLALYELSKGNRRPLPWEVELAKSGL